MIERFDKNLKRKTKDEGRRTLKSIVHRPSSLVLSIFFFWILTTTPASASYTQSTTNYEEEGQITDTVVTGNAADDQVLLGSGVNAATWVSLPSCSAVPTSKLLYTQASNTFSCGTDQDSATVEWYSTGSGTFIANTAVIASGDQIKAVSRESDGAGQIAHLFDTENAFLTAGAQLISIKNQGTAKVTIDKDGKLGMGTTAIPKGGVGGAKLAIEGTAGSVAAGPHVQYTNNTDNYPLFQQLNWDHDNISLNFDAYYDGSWRSAYFARSAQIYKVTDALRFRYSDAQSQGTAITWTDGIDILSNGNIGIGTSTPAAKLDIDCISNSTCLKFYGTTEATEIGEMRIHTTGALWISTKLGAGYIDLRPESNNYGMIIRQADGGAAAWANLYVVDAGTDYMSINVNSATNANALVIASGASSVGVGTSAISNNFQVNGGIRMGFVNAASTQSGSMDMNASGDIGYDMAEAMWVESDVQDGELVSVDPVEGIKLIKSQGSYDKYLIGVASTPNNMRAYPILQIGSPENLEEKFPGRKYRFVSLRGQVEVKVNLDNGPIEVGDWITASSTPGIGMKASHGGAVVGKALERFAGKDGNKEGKLLILVSLKELPDPDQGGEVATLTESIRMIKEKSKEVSLQRDNNQILLEKIAGMNKEQEKVIEMQQEELAQLQKRLSAYVSSK